MYNATQRTQRNCLILPVQTEGELLKLKQTGYWCLRGCQLNIKLDKHAH